MENPVPAPAPETQDDFDLLFRFLTLESASEALKLLEGRPTLLTPKSQGTLRRQTESLAMLKQHGMRNRAEQRRQLFLQVREEGLEKVTERIAKGGTPPGIHGYQLMQIVLEYFQAPSIQSALELLRGFPELLAEGMEKIFQPIVPLCEDRGKAEMFMGAYRTAKSEGVDRAIAQLPRLEFQISLHLCLQTGKPEHFQRALEAATRLVTDVESLELPLAEVLDLLYQVGTSAILLYEKSFWLEFLLLAIGVFGILLDAEAGVENRTRYLGALGSCEIKAFEATGDTKYLEATVAHLQAIFPRDTINDDISPENISFATSLGNALRHRAMVRGNKDDLLRAATIHEKVASMPADAPVIASIRNSNFGASLLNLYFNSGDLRLLRRAMKMFETALTPVDLPSDLRANIANSLARACETAYTVSNDEAELEKAAKAFQQAMENTRQGSPTYRRNLGNYGKCLSELAMKKGIGSMIDRAIELLQHATTLSREGGSEPERSFLLLSGALLNRNSMNPSPKDVESAIETAREAVLLSPPGTPSQLAAMQGLALALYSGNNPEGEATGIYRKVVQGHLASSPEAAVLAATQWGICSFKAKSWAEAAEAFQTGLDAHQVLLGVQATRGDKESRIKQVQGLAPFAVWSLARKGDLPSAVEAAERGRAILLSEFLSGSRAIKVEPLPFAEIQNLAKPGPIVYLDAGLDEGLALIVRHEKDPECLWLPGLTEKELRSRMQKYHRAGQNTATDPVAIETNLEEITRWLWEVAAGPLTRSLEGNGTAAIIAGYYLPLLPLGAAWTPAPLTGTGRRYFLDQLTLTFAPSARALRHARAGEARGTFSILCIEDPQPVERPPLPNAVTEIDLVKRKFPQHRVLRKDAAERSAVLSIAEEYSVLHFACHGETDIVDPLKSGLTMAGGQQLTLEDFLDLELESARLAVLSACETGVMGTRLPDESISLPAGLMQAGVPGTIASLWEVADLGCALLMARFYQLWLDDGLPPSTALNRSQIWLRDTTNAEKASHFANSMELHIPLKLRDPDRRDFAALSAWAAFYYTGV